MKSFTNHLLGLWETMVLCKENEKASAVILSVLKHNE